MESEDESDEDTYVTVGTAFPPLETDQDIVKAKEKKDKDFYVLDQQGRRRFHGAFTGGFSAGYFNTVGSKEGTSHPYQMLRVELVSMIRVRDRRMGSHILHIITVQESRLFQEATRRVYG